jgi:asparagine synthase (glutamine-hydrolysing)
MCGLAGFVGGDLSIEAEKELLKLMTDKISHRGPDGEGLFFDENFRVGLAHRRLAIVDLTPDGAQPMTSGDKRFVITFNGEIYNYLELRAELEAKGAKFRGTSDTEVMIAAFSEWGLVNATKRFNGMFAFTLWDREERSVSLVRDRLGVKPLYYGYFGGRLIFASEIKPLLALLKKLGIGTPSIDRGALSAFMRYNYIPTPLSIFTGIKKLPQGSILTLPRDEISEKTLIQPQHYWNVVDVATKGFSNPSTATYGDIVNEVEELLSDAIRLRMRADVPVGAFLSSGLDSSMVVALMQKSSSRPVKTFTIGVNDEEENEAIVAKEIAKILGTEHQEIYLDWPDAMKLVPSLPKIYDEPFADFSQIPTYIVSRLAREQVTVSLSGDGGDELFGGYNRYIWTENIWSKLQYVPRLFRRGLKHLLRLLTVEQWDALYPRIISLLPARMRVSLPGHKFHKLARVLEASDRATLYNQMLTQWEPTEVVVNGYDVPTEAPASFDNLTLLQYMILQDLMRYLPDDILVKFDRATMAVGLEGREPLLDYRLVEYMISVPDRYKINSLERKPILRSILKKYLPQEIIDRPKRGFSIPVDSWLRTGLKEWGSDLINSDRIKKEGYLIGDAVKKRWDEHLKGTHNWQYPLWNILMFQAWLDELPNL